MLRTNKRYCTYDNHGGADRAEHDIASRGVTTFNCRVHAVKIRAGNCTDIYEPNTGAATDLHMYTRVISDNDFVKKPVQQKQFKSV